MKQRAVTTRRRKLDAGQRFLGQMGRYMKTRGWNVVVAGPIGIIRGVDRAYRHQLVIDFLGVEKQTKNEKKRT